jgi:predicted nucleic acid-binding protein
MLSAATPVITPGANKGWKASSTRTRVTACLPKCWVVWCGSQLIRVFSQSSDLDEVIRFCEVLMEAPHCALMQPGPQHCSIFSRLCKEADARGNLVPDAWFAALAIESGCEWIILDRDYARFTGLRWRLPF